MQNKNPGSGIFLDRAPFEIGDTPLRLACDNGLL